MFEMAMTHPTDDEHVDNGADRAIEKVVFGFAFHTFTMANGDLFDAIPFDFEKGG